MSLRLKRVGKALRALYGVAEGVRPAPAGHVCVVQTHLDQPKCRKPAQVLSAGQALCREHLAQERKPRRR